MSSYAFDRDWPSERARLAVQARLLDPGTVRHLTALGVGRGWRCAEIGAGAGSIALWLADAVAPDGRVLATDVDTRFLAPLSRQNLEVRRHDLLRDPALEAGAFDLVHARLLLMHLPDADEALRRLLRLLRPGGVLLVEEYDLLTAAAFQPPSELQARVAAALERLFEEAGADPHYGLRLVPALRAAGLAGVEAEGRVQVVELGSPLAEALALKLETFRRRLVEARLATDAEVDQAVRGARTPSSGVHYSPLLVAAWGRRGA